MYVQRNHFPYPFDESALLCNICDICIVILQHGEEAVFKLIDKKYISYYYFYSCDSNQDRIFMLKSSRNRGRE